MTGPPRRESELLLYTAPDGVVKVSVLFRDETAWLTQKALAELFGVGVPAINKHLKNIFELGELDPGVTISKMEMVRSEGGRQVTRTVEFYNLDAIIAVGYRVNSYNPAHSTDRLHPRRARRRRPRPRRARCNTPARGRRGWMGPGCCAGRSSWMCSRAAVAGAGAGCRRMASCWATGLCWPRGGLRAHPQALILRWMPTHDRPPPPGFHELGAVQADRGDRRSANRGLADDDVPRGTPAEMIRPGLPSWVEEAYDFPRAGIESGYPIAPMIVAHRARKPEVLPDGQTSQRLGDDVIDLHRRAGDAGRGQAVAAAVARLRGNLLAQRLGDVATAHAPGATPRRRDLAV